MNEVCDWEIGNYVAVRQDRSWYPGKITRLHENGRVEVKRMTYVDKFARTNKFEWSGDNPCNFSNLDRSDLLLALNEPSMVTTGKRLQHYKLTEDDYNDASNVLKLVLS